MVAEPEKPSSDQGFYWLVSFVRCHPIRVYHLRQWSDQELRDHLIMASYLEAERYLATWRRIYPLRSRRPNYPFAPPVVVARNPWAESSLQSSLVLSALIPPSRHQAVRGVALLPAA